MPLALQIMANHGRIDAGTASTVGNVMPPEVLEQKVKAESEAKALAVLRQISEQQDKAKADMAELKRLSEVAA